ncbi:DUF4189 domain-containing protein [Neorhizobium alkalisoli]|jgi:hypothetical protein|uniref:Uncharacterized protein DUF4189 n=1 Tax=Neorhizobium alkalisoli TaxID=528178 RepID=A0A561QX81_9HYPH|nr:DUF4189 domain-containing protein [Neorhizobium alkalisoli]TWF54975.1 uncharacterized protein DUF4189 [Neorhizobium alkalisoli]
MKTAFKTGLAAVALSAAFIASNTTAFAWGCIAVSDEGTYGYSYNFNNENGARKRALNECAARTTEDSDCEITECDEDL